jgi:PAS domain S-box-containing protein
MKAQSKTKQVLTEELTSLRRRIQELEQSEADRKKAEEARRDAEFRYRLLFEHSPYGIVIIDPVSARPIEFNETAYRQLGYSREEFAQLSISDLDVIETSEETRVTIADVIQKGRIDFETKQRTRLGEIRDFHVTAQSTELQGKTVYHCIWRDVTERRQAEELLRNSHRRLDDIIDFLPDATFVIDCDGKVVAWNKATEQMTGVPKAEMIGKGNYEYAIPFYGKRRPILIDLALLQNENFDKKQYDFIYMQGDIVHTEGYVPRAYGGKGAYTWGSATRLRDASGNIVGAIETTRNISDRKRAEEDIRKAEEKYRSIFENAIEGISQTTPEGRCITVNPAFAGMFGFASPEEMLAQVTDIDQLYVNQADRERINNVLSTQGYLKGFEVERRRKDGTRLWNSMNTRSVRDSNGAILYFEGTNVDITDRKKAEEALLKSERRYREFFSTSRDCVFITSKKGKWIDFNNAALEMFGYDGREELSQVPISALYVNPDEHAALMALIEKQGYVKEYPALLRRRNGEVIDTLITAGFRQDVDGQYYGTIRDITKHKRAEDALRVSREQMRALAERLQVVREEERINIAREIHDELGGYLTGLKIDFSFLTKAASIIENEVIRKSLLDRMESITKSIDTTFKTVRRIAMELRPGVLDDLGLVAALEWQLHDFQKRSGILCEFFPPVKNISLAADLSIALFRIVQEALTNVARHSGATEVSVHLRTDSASFILEVEDNGKGIEKEMALSSKSLGLLGMKERVQMFGGRISVMGTPGIGTTVTVEIPYVEKRKIERVQEGDAG